MPELFLRLARLTGLTTLVLTVICGVLNAPIATTALLCLMATAALWRAPILDTKAGGIDFLVALFLCCAAAFLSAPPPALPHS